MQMSEYMMNYNNMNHAEAADRRSLSAAQTHHLFQQSHPLFSFSILPLLGFISSPDRGTRMGEEWLRML